MDSDRHFGRVRLLTPTLEATIQTVADRPEAPTAIRTNLSAIFVSLELSRSTWLITSLSPGGGEKMSKQVVRGGDVAELLERFARLREKAQARTGKVFPFVVIQEAGLDGFWIDRALQNEGIESHIVDPASIATSRRRRRAKTDGIDGEVLVRALLAYKRGEPRVCAMIKAPTPEDFGSLVDDPVARCARPAPAPSPPPRPGEADVSIDADRPSSIVRRKFAKRKLSCSGHATTPLAGGATDPAQAASGLISTA